MIIKINKWAHELGVRERTLLRRLQQIQMKYPKREIIMQVTTRGTWLVDLSQLGREVESIRALCGDDNKSIIERVEQLETIVEKQDQRICKLERVG